MRFQLLLIVKSMRIKLVQFKNENVARFNVIIVFVKTQAGHTEIPTGKLTFLT